MALERDGFFYDVEALELAARDAPELRDGAPTPLAAIEGDVDAADFHARVVSLGAAGLRELDTLLARGFRPGEAWVEPSTFAPLAPCDTARATYVHIDPRASAAWPVRIGHARSLVGQDALLDVPDGEHLDFEVGVAALIGEDLERASATEVRSAIAGWMVLVEVVMLDVERAATCHLSTPRGSRVAVGPWLTPPHASGRLEDARVSLTLRGATVDVGPLGEHFGARRAEEAIARASSLVPIAAGDLVGLGPLPRATGRALAIGWQLHERLDVVVGGLGALRVTAVSARERARG
ncbi:MAG: fumarylacetoacetate hydrolase family protein [Polyangiaceae bacterium]